MLVGKGNRIPTERLDWSVQRSLFFSFHVLFVAGRNGKLSNIDSLAHKYIYIYPNKKIPFASRTQDAREIRHFQNGAQFVIQQHPPVAAPPMQTMQQ